MAIDRPSVCATLAYNSAANKSDLLNPSITTDQVVKVLQYLPACGHTILVTMVSTGHHVDSSPGGHGHNSAGDAVDCWIADWQKVGDAKILDMIQLLAKWSRKAEMIQQVGLAGVAANYMTYVTWGTGFNIFYDSGADHVHISALLPNDRITWGGNLLPGD